MQIVSLSFGRTAHTPTAANGITIALEPPHVTAALFYSSGRDPSGRVRPHVHGILGACRVLAASHEAGLRVPRAIFLTLQVGTMPSAYTLNLVGERLVFDDDVERLGDDWLCAFRCELDVSAVATGAFMLHASLCEHTSNCIWVV